MTPETRRLFFAWMLGEGAAGEVAERVRAELGGEHASRAFRLPRADGLHVTALFLGDVDAEPWLGSSDELRERLLGLSLPTLRLTHAGGFPSLPRPRVLWLGLDEASEAALAPWRERLVTWAEERGFEGADARRPFRPHLTVARPRGVRSAPEGFASGEWDVSWKPLGLSLLESCAAERGPRRYVERFLVESG